MQTIQTRERSAIERHLRRDVFLHLYEIGDLDEFFWPFTTWFAGVGDPPEAGDTGAGRTDQEALELRHLALLYTATSLPVLLFLTRDAGSEAGDRAVDSAAAWLGALRSELPARFYAHLSPGLEEALRPSAELEPHGPHLKMALTRPKLDVAGADRAVRLGPGDRAELEAFYRTAYPGNWFDPRMLETGQYFGVREEGRGRTPGSAGGLAAVAGVHVYAPAQGVAALGNIATLPACRGRGLARAVTARLCATLLENVAHVGLNVHARNAAAIACYEGLGFETIAEYGEFLVTRG